MKHRIETKGYCEGLTMLDELTNKLSSLGQSVNDVKIDYKYNRTFGWDFIAVVWSKPYRKMFRWRDGITAAVKMLKVGCGRTKRK